MITLPISQNQEHIYDIILDDGILFEHLDLSAFHRRKAFIVSDQNVGPLYTDKLKKAVSNVFSAVYDIALIPGESAKNLEQIGTVYAALCEAHFDRHDLIIALGGGVIGDMAGFAASTYMRGIRFIQIPTTLLSQTDSSIGGKTGVDFQGFKNIVGAFYMPSLVYIHPTFLHTLSSRQVACGMGEIIKHGLILDRDYAAFLKEHVEPISFGNIEYINQMIARSCQIKGGVVERDPKEKGERMLLNFGHTIGHALEKELDFKLLHGECVALGAVAASYISYRRNMITLQDLKQIEQLFFLYRLPIRVTKHGLQERLASEQNPASDSAFFEKLNDSILPEKIISHIKSDKKMDNKKIHFVLLQNIGKAVVDDSVTDKEIVDAVAYILDCSEAL